MSKILNNKLVLLLIGFLIGISLTVLVAFSIIKDVVVNIEEDYAPELTTLKDVGSTALPAVAQKDYVLAGLTLSADFQELLEHGVQYGWWTEEYLTQVLIDDVVPVYIDQYAGTFGIIKGTEQYDNLVDTVQDIIDAVSKLPKDEIRNLVSTILTIDRQSIINKINSLKGIPALIDGLDIDEKIDTALELKNKLPLVIETVQGKLDIIESLTKDDIMGVVLDSDKVSELIESVDEAAASLAEAIENVEGIASDKLEELQTALAGVQAVLEEVSAKLSAIKDSVDNTLDDVDSDYHFVAGTNTILGHSFELSAFKATLLNAIDITIVETSYSNNSTPANLSDDELIIGQVYLKFESSTGEGIDIVLGNITIEGKMAFLIHSNLGMINNAI